MRPPVADAATNQREAMTGREVAGILTFALVGTGCGGASSLYSSSIDFGVEATYVLPTEMCGDYFVAPVLIEGRGPFPFLLDSGAKTTLIDSETADQLGLRSRADLKIGDFAARGVQVRESDMSQVSRALGHDVSGILGHPVFRDFLLTYDYGRRRVVLEEGALEVSEPGTVRTHNAERPFVDADIGGQSTTLLIDTGSGLGLTLLNLERLALVSPLAVTGARMRMDGVHLVLSGRLDGSAFIGPMRLEHPIVHGSESVNLIGQAYLTKYILQFDQRNALMRFEHIGSTRNPPVTSDAVMGTGVVVAPVGDSWQVIHVRADTEFQGSTLETGDTVTSVDGRILSERQCPTRVEPEGIQEWTEFQATGFNAVVRARVRTLVR